MAATTSAQVLTSVKNLLDSGKYSDFTIICGDETHKVHKAVVCSRSGFFERAERFPVGREAAENTIKLTGDDPKIIALLLEFLYTGEYTPKLPFPTDSAVPLLTKHTCPKPFGLNNCAEIVCGHHVCSRNCAGDCKGFSCFDCVSQRNDSQLLVHSKLYSLADKYEVPGLQEMARLKFEESCKLFWNSASFVTVTEHVFTSTPDQDVGLRKTVKTTLAEHRLALIQKPRVQSFLTKRPEVMIELLKRKKI